MRAPFVAASLRNARLCRAYTQAARADKPLSFAIYDKSAHEHMNGFYL